MPLPDPSELVHTRDGAEWRRAERTWPFGTWGRASEVRAGKRKAVLLELEGDWSDVLAADHDATGEHVLTAFERGRFVRSEVAGSAYRSPSVEPVATRYALLPWILGGTLAPALARARGGESLPPEIVASIGLEIAIGLASTSELGVLTPSAIVVDARGGVSVRGPLLTSVVTRTGASTLAAMPYTAPEVLRANGAWSEAARTFALGVMLHDLLQGSALFGDGADGARAIARWKAPSVARMPTGPAPLRSALGLMLQGDPHRRASPRAIVDLLAPIYAPSAEIASALLGETRAPMPFFAT
jgi:hypothetical protein